MAYVVMFKKEVLVVLLDDNRHFLIIFVYLADDRFEEVPERRGFVRELSISYQGLFTTL